MTANAKIKKRCLSAQCNINRKRWNRERTNTPQYTYIHAHRHTYTNTDTNTHTDTQFSARDSKQLGDVDVDGGSGGGVKAVVTKQQLWYSDRIEGQNNLVLK